MGRLIYSAIASLDGYVADESGGFEWAAPDEEVHAFVNELARPIGTHLYGRRMYEVMSAWETMDDDAPEMRDFAQIWRAADKVVYSRTLAEPTTARTRLEREFDPDAVSRLKARPGPTSASVARGSRERRSVPASWTSFTCSSPPWWWAAVPIGCPATCASGSSSWASAASPAGSSTCTTVSISAPPVRQ